MVDTNNCLRPVTPLSFTCIMTIVNKFRAGEVDVTLGRMILQQIDSGLAQFGSLPPEPEVTIQEEQLGAVCEEAEKLCEIYQKDENVAMNVLPVIVILLKMWSLYRKYNS